MKQTLENTNLILKAIEYNAIGDEETEFYDPVLFMYGKNTQELHGSLHIVDNDALASIATLNSEIDEQREKLKIPYVDNGEAYEFIDFKPRELGLQNNNFVVCQEGVFEWNWEKEVYERIGHIQKTIRIDTTTVFPLPEEQNHYITADYQDLAIIRFSKSA